jgi:hypothetical protein
MEGIEKITEDGTAAGFIYAKDAGCGFVCEDCGGDGGVVGV